MSIRVSNQVANIPGREIELNDVAPTIQMHAHGYVGGDNIATLTVDDAQTIDCQYWHAGSKTWRYAGYGAAVYQVVFEALGTYSWTVPKGSWVRFISNTTGPLVGYTDLLQVDGLLTPPAVGGGA